MSCVCKNSAWAFLLPFSLYPPTHPPPATNHREPIALGKAYANYPCVRQFKILPNLGHCPMDEGPEQVNPFIREFVDTLEKEAKAKAQ